MHELMDVLRRQAHYFGPELAKTAYQRGLAVTKPDGSTQPIPITATPVILDAEEIKRRALLSAEAVAWRAVSQSNKNRFAVANSVAGSTSTTVPSTGISGLV